MKYIGALNSADKLTVPRDIAGSAFDGTADIDIDFDELVDKPSLGTAAARNAPASGNAGAAEVVLGNDTRLTDARPANGGNAASVTTNANLTGQVTSVGNATSIAANVVTNSKLAQVSTQTVKGRLTAGSGNVEDITISDLRAAIGSTYTLPAASASTLGGIKIGSGLAIDGNGTVTATGGSKWISENNPSKLDYVKTMRSETQKELWLQENYRNNLTGDNHWTNSDSESAKAFREKMSSDLNPSKQKEVIEKIRLKAKEQVVSGNFTLTDPEVQELAIEGLRKRFSDRKELGLPAFSEEHRKNLSKPQKLVECPHCNKVGGLNNMNRYHFDNCKKRL
jgi:hypothetical protein